MRNQIIYLNEDKYKVFGYSNDQIIISSKEHSTFESLYESSSKSGMLESVKVIPMQSLKQVVLKDWADDWFTLEYTKKEKNKNFMVVLVDKEIRSIIINDISEINNFRKSVGEESKLKTLFINMLFVIGTSLFTLFAWNIATNAQNGTFHTSGRMRVRFIQNLIADISDVIGVVGVTSIGVIIVLYFVYNTITGYSNPAKEIKYS